MGDIFYYIAETNKVHTTYYSLYAFYRPSGKYSLTKYYNELVAVVCIIWSTYYDQTHWVVCLLLQTLWIQRFIGAAKNLLFSMEGTWNPFHPPIQPSGIIDK